MILSRCSLKLLYSLASLVVILLFGSSHFTMERVFGKIVFKFNVGKKNHPYSYLDFRKGLFFFLVILYLLEIQTPLRMASHLFSAVSSTLKGHASSLAPPGTLFPSPWGPASWTTSVLPCLQVSDQQNFGGEVREARVIVHIRSPQAGCSSRPKASSLRTQITELCTTWLSLYVPSLL